MLSATQLNISHWILCWVYRQMLNMWLVILSSGSKSTWYCYKNSYKSICICLFSWLMRSKIHKCLYHFLKVVMACNILSDVPHRFGINIRDIRSIRTGTNSLILSLFKLTLLFFDMLGDTVWYWYVRLIFFKLYHTIISLAFYLVRWLHCLSTHWS